MRRNCAYTSQRQNARQNRPILRYSSATSHSRPLQQVRFASQQSYSINEHTKRGSSHGVKNQDSITGMLNNFSKALGKILM